MKTPLATLALALAGLLHATTATAALNIPSDGSDGALVITRNTVIDLAEAPTGTWDANNAANAGKGIYDPTKWAVVFKYASVNVAAGATVTFKNHPSRAPVVWLVAGDATLAGTVNVSGQDGQNPPLLAEPGPGGFRGGVGQYSSGVSFSSGFGPVGRTGYDPGLGGPWFAGGGSFGPQPVGSVPTYGNPSLIPLIGGPGGGGATADRNPWGGGGGGGAVLVAVAGLLDIRGTIVANGGNVSSYLGGSPGAGSGGGIRLVASVLSGSGKAEALGGTGGRADVSLGGPGRIAVERASVSGTVQFVPLPFVTPLAADATPRIWPGAGSPEVRIVSVGGVTAPSDPRAAFGAEAPDIALPRTTRTQVILETTNAEQQSVVRLRLTHRTSPNVVETNAVFAETVSQNPLVLRWRADLPVLDGYAALVARVIRP